MSKRTPFSGALFKSGLFLFLSLLIECSSAKCENEKNCTKEHQEVFRVTTTEIPQVLKPVVTDFFFVGSQISTIPNRAFVANPQLERVEFMNTPTVSVEAGAFKGLDKLISIEISSTPLMSVPVGVFAEVPHLETLVLKANKLRGLEKGLFDGLQQLQILYLHLNEILSIEDGTFDELKSLKVILYTTLLVLVVICTLVLGKFAWSLYRLLQQRGGLDGRVNFTSFSYRKEVILRPLQEAETVRL
ncbi:hypothetical protein NHX12_015959 [Muraenolepis orangiensis]|uniref:Uncharacterized protein n=1 Tax=Muraenolepis orangiensis TaxID=630683 RepID=A0A9Q0I1G7_9TELE|nr:hypothetical protein NHX12_015959 [Muraenolepis orangiensis]